MQSNRKQTGGIRSAVRTAWARWLKHVVTLLLFSVVASLLFSLIRHMDWQAVVETLRGYSPALVIVGVGITAASFVVFSSYDLLGKWYTGHPLPMTQVLPLAFVCYAFNLNLGAWVGGIALRYRLYTQFGLSVATVTRVLSVSLAGVHAACRCVICPWDNRVAAALAHQHVRFAIGGSGVIGYLL